ncbi:MAG: sel1 repeat family protein [Chlorobi bacterium]|nr:sel1 repeat family protein [Chlorobiota bacterium]
MKTFWLAMTIALVGAVWAQQPLPSHHDVGTRTLDDSAAAILGAVHSWWGIGRAADPDSACRVATAWAARDPLAAFIFAECIADRRRMPPDVRRADSVFEAVLVPLRERADRGDAYALVALAEYYRRGLGGVVPDDDAATSLLRRAAGMGNPLAAFLLARTSDDSTSLMFLRRAAEGNVVAAMVMLARRLLADSSSLAEAIGLLRRAEERGSPDAALVLGGCYDSGLGVEPNPTQALRSIAVAADRGSVAAMLELGVRSIYGVGMPADTIGGLVWLLRAVARSSPAERRAIVGLLSTVCDSLPMVARHFERALGIVAAELSPARHDSSALVYLLTGDGARLWRAWWRPSVGAPEYVGFRRDGAAIVSGSEQLFEWRCDTSGLLAITNEGNSNRARLIAIAEGLCAVEWDGGSAFYSPIESATLGAEPYRRHRAFVQPSVELLPPRTGDDYVRLRVRVRNVPRTGLVLMPIGIARDRAATHAEIAVSAGMLWRIWDDGVHELLWQPPAAELPAGLGAKCVLFVQCVWQYDGDDRSMIVKSQPIAVPSRWRRR